MIAEPKRIDAQGSVWFNLSKAYLARRQTKKARTAANEFARMRKTEARGYMLLGDTYFIERDWPNALDQYLRAGEGPRQLNKPHTWRTRADPVKAIWPAPQMACITLRA